MSHSERKTERYVRKAAQPALLGQVSWDAMSELLRRCSTKTINKVIFAFDAPGGLIPGGDTDAQLSITRLVTENIWECCDAYKHTNQH